MRQEKEIINNKTIIICDICNKQVPDEFYIKTINGKDYCRNGNYKCLENFKNEYSKKCSHENIEISFRDYYGYKIRFYCEDELCSFLVELNERKLINNKVIKEELLKIWKEELKKVGK